MIVTDNFLHLLGGVDIDPSYYGHRRLKQTQPPNHERDKREFAATRFAINHKLPIIGVCRGAQLLCIQAGGSLYQHSNNHNESHSLTHKGGYIKHAAASHHQIMNLDEVEEKEVIAWCPFPTIVLDEMGREKVLDNSPEVIWFPRIRGLAIQPHPEWETEGSEFKVWINNIVKQKTGLDNFF